MRPAYWSIKNISKPLFHLIRSSTKIIEFGNVKFPQNVSSEGGVCRELLEIDSNKASSKTDYFKNVCFLILRFHSVSYKNVFDIKKI